MGTAAVLGPAAAVSSAGVLVADAAGVTGLAAGKILLPRILNDSHIDFVLLGATGLAAGSELAAAYMAAQSIVIATLPAGPFGWVIGVGALVSGAVIVAGDADMAEPRC